MSSQKLGEGIQLWGLATLWALLNNWAGAAHGGAAPAGLA